MPTYTYKCETPGCLDEFETFHSIMIKLEFCPHCKEAGRGEEQPIQRLIDGGVSRHIVVLGDNEFKESLSSESHKIYEQAANNETFAENFIGSKYRA